MEMSSGDGPKPKDFIELELKPHVIASCREYGKELVKSVAAEERIKMLNTDQEGYIEKLRAMKKQLKDESRSIYTLERSEQSIYGDKEKVLQAMGDITQHETQIWDVLGTHINQTAITLAEYKRIQGKYSEERDQGSNLEVHARQLEEKANNLKVALQNMKVKKIKLEEEGKRLRDKISPELFQQKANKLAEYNEKLNQIRQEATAAQGNLKEKQELIRGHEEQEKLLQKSIEELQQKFRQSITEMNNLKLQIEEKSLERDKDLQGIQEKVDLVQKFCETVQNDLRNSLSADYDHLNSEIMSNKQKNQCLEENFNTGCMKQKELDHETVKVRAAIWQEKELHKERILKETDEKRDLIAEKRKLLAKLKRRLNDQKDKQIKESIARPIRANLAKKPRMEFKKPISQPISNRLLLTNTLFDQLRTKPLSQRGGGRHLDNMVTSGVGQTEADSHSETSIMSMSSIEDLSVLGSRL